MIKSELVQRIADQNTHLYQRDIENIVSAILDEIVKALEGMLAHPPVVGPGVMLTPTLALRGSS